GEGERGWTLNSAGYLLGPHALDSHRSFQDKHGLAGKRELEPEGEARPGERTLIPGRAGQWGIGLLPPQSTTEPELGSTKSVSCQSRHPKPEVRSWGGHRVSGPALLWEGGRASQ
uniref:Galanin domain-containing protein n=1 Tax=Bos mutus grunniens TaxID=30521 RepID=A0A8B9WXW1_BOSMU